MRSHAHVFLFFFVLDDTLVEQYPSPCVPDCRVALECHFVQCGLCR